MRGILFPWGTAAHEFKQSAVRGETQVFAHVTAGSASSGEKKVRGQMKEKKDFGSLCPLIPPLPHQE